MSHSVTSESCTCEEATRRSRLARSGAAAVVLATTVGFTPMPVGAVTGPSKEWQGSVDDAVSYYGGLEIGPANRYAKHAYESNPISSTLVAVDCGDGSVWLGSLQQVPTQDHGARTLSGVLAEGSCWKVRVRNSVNSQAYWFWGTQFG